MFQILVERLPRRVEAVIAANGGPNSILIPMTLEWDVRRASVHILLVIKCIYIYIFTHTHTVEAGSLHPLRLESLKLVFQPLHVHVLFTNYGFGKSVRTSTVCITQVIVPTIVSRHIILLIIHCTAIPVGQKFTYTKLTVPLNSMENSRKVCHGFRSFW
jgi:hypothetical protein